jgi:hypothetical protein
MGAATKIHDGNAEGLEEHVALVGEGVGRHSGAAQAGNSIRDGVSRLFLRCPRKLTAEQELPSVKFAAANTLEPASEV